MGLLDNLPFRKKKDNLALEVPDLGMGTGMPEQQPTDFYGAPQQPQGYGQQQYGAPESFQSQQTYQQQGMSSTSRDLELISAKLDVLKATIDSMNQRLASMERYFEEGRRRTW
jgi:hypothetical protein